MSKIQEFIFLILSFFSLNSQTEAREIKLEEQISMLEELGLKLNQGVTIEDLLYSWDRQGFEKKPFDTILFSYGSEVEKEPWGRNVCDRAWNFDVEFIEGNGSYIEIVSRFSLVAGMPERISEITDKVNFETGEAWVSYQLDGKKRKHNVVIQDDWADPDAVAAIMEDMLKPDYRFYYIDNGQASIWFYLTAPNAKKLNQLSGNLLKKT